MNGLPTVPAATTPTAPAIPAISPPATTPICFGACLIDVQSPSADLRAIQPGDCLLALFVTRHLYETKTARTPRFAIRENADPVDLPVRFEELT